MQRGLVFLALMTLTLSCGRKFEKTKPIREPITESVYAAGTIKARDQYQVYATVSGIISRIFVVENDLVRKGTPIIELTDQTSKYNRENADLTAKFSELRANQEKLVDLQNSISLAEKKFSNDSLVYRRQQNLWNEGIGTKLDLEQKELASQNSKIALESARIKYHDLRRQLEYNEKEAKNNLEISRSKEKDFTIKSEMNGRIYFIYPEKGEIVNPQTALAVIGDSSHFLMDLAVDEYDIVKIKIGQQVLVSMDSYKDEIFEGSITKINPLMNDRTRTFSVEAEFTRRPPVLYPNLTVEANIVIQRRRDALTIPRNYLLNDSFVIVDKDKKKLVKTGLKDYQKVEIVQGLTPNDFIYKPAP